MIVRELLTKIGYKVDNKPLEKSEHLVKRFKQALATLGVGVAVRAINGMVNSAAALQAQMGDLATELDVSKQFVREYGWAAKQSGSDIQYVAKSIDFLKRNASAARSGDALAIQKFKELGITLEDLRGPLQDNERLFEATGLRLAGLTDSQQRARLQMELMGGTAKKLQGLFARGADGLAELRQSAQAVLISESESDKLAEFDNMVQVTKMSLQSMADRVAIALLPAFKAFHGFLKDASRDGGIFRRMVDGLSRGLDYLRRNADKVAIVIGSVFGAATLAAVGMLTMRVLGFANALRSTKTAVQALQGSILLIPLAIGAAVVALLLISEELLAFGEKETVLDLLVEKFEGLRAAIETASNAAKALRDTLTDIIPQALVDFLNSDIMKGAMGQIPRGSFEDFYAAQVGYGDNHPQGWRARMSRSPFLSYGIPGAPDPNVPQHWMPPPATIPAMPASPTFNDYSTISVTLPPGSTGSPQENAEAFRQVYREERARELHRDLNDLGGQ